MRISDWSSDVCSSDLLAETVAVHVRRQLVDAHVVGELVVVVVHRRGDRLVQVHPAAAAVRVAVAALLPGNVELRSEEHTSELQSLMRISYAVFCLKKKTQKQNKRT